MLFGGICFITERTISPLSVEEQVKMVLDAGIGWIQYREKELSRRDIFFQAERLKRLAEGYNAIFIVNDHPDIALAVDSDGVHLGQDDFPLKEAKKIMGTKIVGISTHDLRQARDAELDGAGYIGFGPMFQTSTKDAGSPKGLEYLGEVAESVNIPVVAIGGINLDNLRDVLRAGASAVAVASGILKGDDIYRKAKEFVRIINEPL